MSVFGDVVIKELFDALVGNPTLLGIGTGVLVFDHVPQETPYPFVAIGELVDTPTDHDDTERMSNMSITIHSYSRQWGRKETHDIQVEITKTLHRANLAVTGFKFVSIDHEQSQSFTDDDGNTRHGIVEFKIIMTEDL